MLTVLQDRSNGKVFSWCWNESTNHAEPTLSGSVFQICIDGSAAKCLGSWTLNLEITSGFIPKHCLCDLVQVVQSHYLFRQAV